MFCKKCGTQIPDGQMCPNCNPQSTVKGQHETFSKEARPFEKKAGEALKGEGSSFNKNTSENNDSGAFSTFEEKKDSVQGSWREKAKAGVAEGYEKPLHRRGEGLPGEKKSRKRLWTLIILLVVLLGGGAIFASWWVSPAQKLKRLLSRGQIDQAVALLEDPALEDQGGEMKATLSDTILQRGEELYQRYAKEEIGFSEVEAEINKMLSTNAMTQKDNVRGILQKTMALRDSRQAFGDAEVLLKNKDYEKAIEKFRKVIPADSNFENAKTKLESTIQEYKKNILEESRKLYDEKNYTEAMVLLNTAKQTLPEDREIAEKIAEMESTQTKALVEETLKEAKTASDEKDFAKAIKIIQAMDSKLQDEAKIIAALNEYRKLFSAQTMEKSNEMLGQRDYKGALEYLRDARSLVPEDGAINEKIALVEKTFPEKLVNINITKSESLDILKEIQTDTLGNSYPTDNLMKISAGGWHPVGFGDFYLNGKYSAIEGIVAISSASNQDIRMMLEIYADGKRIYETKALGVKTEPFKVSLNVRDVKWLQIRAIREGYNQGSFLLHDFQLFQE